MTTNRKPIYKYVSFYNGATFLLRKLNGDERLKKDCPVMINASDGNDLMYLLSEVVSFNESTGKFVLSYIDNEIDSNFLWIIEASNNIGVSGFKKTLNKIHSNIQHTTIPLSMSKSRVHKYHSGFNDNVCFEINNN